MARPVDPQRRAALLEQATDFAIANGLADLTLRPLAAGIGVAPNTLTHHFGSKDALIGEILTSVRDRLRAIHAQSEPTDAGRLRRVWGWSSAPDRRPFFRSFFEAYGVALRDPRRFGPFLDRVVADWVPADESTTARATLEIAVVRGLLLDLLATGDTARTDAAFELYEQISRQAPAV